MGFRFKLQALIGISYNLKDFFRIADIRQLFPNK